VLLPLLALLAGAGIAAALLQALSEGPPASTASASEQQDSGSIVLDAANYIGRPVNVVTQRLTALGLNVELREEVTSDAVPDRVTAVEPHGEFLAAGDTVTVTYAVAPPETPSSGRDGAAVSGAAVADPVVDSAEPTTEAPPSEVASTSASLPASVEPTATPTVTTSESSATETSPVSDSSGSSSAATTTESTTTASSSSETSADEDD
jgi:serine/threonine-protein kinase